jgi:glutamate-1-semialdehyde 2,1-aminomutase
LSDGLLERALAANLPVRGTQVGSMFSLFFTENEAIDWTSVSASDTDMYAEYFKAMLSKGIYLAPSQFEAGFISILHDDDVIEATLRAAEKAFSEIED